MRKLFVILLALIVLPVALAINVDIQKTSSDEAMIVGLDEPGQFTLNLTNNGPTQRITIYSLGHFSFVSFLDNSGFKDNVEIERGETKNLTIPIYQRPDSNLRGKTTFVYYIQGSNREEIEKKLTINLVELEDALEIIPGEINPNSKELTISLKNILNFEIENLSASFYSPFFSFEKDSISLGPYEAIEFKVQIEKEDYKELMAGFYTVYADLKLEDLNAEISSKIKFIEEDNLTTKRKDYGFLVTTKIVEKINEGNTLLDSEIIMKKNILSRLFTTYNVDPDQVERQGTKVYYTWTDKIGPGESIEVSLKTNWLFPLLTIIFFVVLIYFVKKYSAQKVQIRKRVSFVKAKGGEFALKITIIAQAREFVEKVKVIDRLPPLVKMYERFGGELPDKVSQDKKRLEWDFDYLDAGESRIMTYIVYSKVGILGKFALPGTICRFEQEGKQKQTVSNKAFFLAEQKDKRKPNKK